MTAAADMKPSKALRKARDLITPERAWIKEMPALMADCSYATYEDGQCFCSLGAIWHVMGGWYQEEVTPVETFLLRTINGFSIRPDIAHWNDAPDRTHAEVLDAFDRAIALAEAEGR